MSDVDAGSSSGWSTERAEELVVRATVIARRLARPLGLVGLVSLAQGLFAWLLLSAPIWGDGAPLWSSAVALAVLCAPGLWLLVHHRWLDRSLHRAAELSPNTRVAVRAAYDGVRDRGAGRRSGGGALRQAWRFYTTAVSPLKDQAEDVLAVTRPLRPSALTVTGVALVCAALLLVLVPLAMVVRLALVVT